MSARPARASPHSRMRPPAHSSTYLTVATLRDAAAIVALHNAAADELTRIHGSGFGSGRITSRGLRHEMTRGVVYVRRERGRILATLTLSRRKPWAIDPAYFASSRRPLYLTAMAVHPAHQRRGVGRRCVEQLRALAEDWQADAVRLDAYDAPSGAGGFYARCGMREVGRVVYRKAPLVYYEWLPPAG